MTVSEYINRQPSEWRPTIQQLFLRVRRTSRSELCQAGAVPFALYPQEACPGRTPIRTRGVRLGEGCIRSRRTEQVDLDVVCRLIADTVANNDKIC